jgi:hypothetical protein
MFLCYFRFYSYRTEIAVQCSIELSLNTLFNGTVSLKGDKNAWHNANEVFLLVNYITSHRTQYTDLVFEMILVSSNSSSILWSYVSHTESQLRKVILPWQVPLYTVQTKQCTYDTQSECQSMSVMYGTIFMCTLCQWII